jgi:subtilase family serine protease
MQNRFLSTLSVIALMGAVGSSLALAQQSQALTPTPSRIVDKIDNTNLVTLRGNVLKALTPDRDMGLVEESLPVRLYLSLQRTPAQQADLDALLAAQQNPKSAMYHKWLTPEQFGARFGASESDIQKVRDWLQSEGFEVTSVPKNKSVINVKTTAAGVRETFHAQLHYWNIEGGKYVATKNEPQIPTALASLVTGIAGLNQIPFHTQHTPVHQERYDADTHKWYTVKSIESEASGATPDYLASNGHYNMTPQDYYTIYNVNPTYTAGNHGEGSTIAIIAFSDFNYGTVSGGTAGGTATGGDAVTFRNLFGVTKPLNLKVQHGNANFPCDDPGVTSAEGEFALDTEWSGALAPAANIILSSCGNATTGIQAIVDDNVADVISSSIGIAEALEGSGDRQTTDTALAQAATQGQTYLSAQGDSGSDDYDFGSSQGTHGLSIDYPGSSPLVLSIGGTDFQDTYDSQNGGVSQSTYWSATNSQFYGDALGYVPEMSWNESCGSPFIAFTSDFGGSPGESTATYCNGGQNNLFGGGGGGGISSLYAQPSWQTGIPGLSASITHRVTPDVSMFASGGGYWGHGTVLCDSTSADSACTSPSTFGGAGGTSFAAPEFAGILGLLRTGTGSRQGLVQPALYALAKAQYTAGTACYANGQSANTGITTGLPASTCIFHDVTTSGNNNVRSRYPQLLYKPRRELRCIHLSREHFDFRRRLRCRCEI